MNIPYFSNYKNDASTDTIGIKSSDKWEDIVGGPRRIKSGTFPRKTGTTHSRVEQILHSAAEGKAKTYTAGMMIIPDAYRIELTIKSMVPESKNLFFHSALGQGTRSSGLYGVTVKQSGAFANVPNPALPAVAKPARKLQSSAEQLQLQHSQSQSGWRD